MRIGLKLVGVAQHAIRKVTGLRVPQSMALLLRRCDFIERGLNFN
jgi:hypothetical protein